VAEHGDEHHATEPEAERVDRSATTSIWPIGFAAGVALLLVGVVLNWVVFGIGVGIAVLFGALWVYQAARSRRPVPVVVEEEEEESEELERYGRNVFLERTTLGLGAVIGGAITVPVVGFAVAPTFIDQGDEEIDLGSLENFPEGEWIVTTFESKEREGTVSRQTTFIRNNGTTADGAPSFTIISNRCAHLGCPTQPAGPTDDPREVEAPVGTIRLIPAQPSGFVCPCHGGSYDLEGNRTAGPPVRSLDRFVYKIVDGNLVLGDRYSVGVVEGEGAEARIKAYHRLDPGQHVDGPTAWLYPASPRGV
jgi:menaquinol-cytochrome c reductase iron-sulfur subunit